jgi:hypothetical protein
MSCELVRCSTHHVIDHVVVLNIQQLQFIHALDGTVVQVLLCQALGASLYQK